MNNYEKNSTHIVNGSFRNCSVDVILIEYVDDLR